jgi:hypothetical protein
MPKLDYYNTTYKGLSYSRELTLNSCPKKFELDAKYSVRANRSSVTFSYGHSVAAGIQYALGGHTHARSIVETFVQYEHDVEDVGNDSEKASKKSIWHSLLSVDEFYAQYKNGLFKFLDGWEIARIYHPESGELIDAIELTFVIELLEGYTFEGHIDLILWHPIKKRFMVVELKTTGMSTVNEASYRNSSQALGYGAVLDLMADQLGHSASFDVLYLVWQSRTKTLVPMPFSKTAKDRVDWLNKLMIDMELIELYEKHGYPKHGESCFNFFRPCEYIDKCGMSGFALERMFSRSGEGSEENVPFSKLETPTFMFTLEQLLDRQANLIEAITSGDVNENGDAELALATFLPTD